MGKLAIFDLDGTLIDSLPDIEYYVNQTLEKFGYQRRSYTDVRKFIGNGARNLVKDCIGEEISSELLDERLAYYNRVYTSSGSPRTKVYDGVKELLYSLKEKGFKIAVLTNKPQETTDNVMQNYFGDVEFDMVVGYSEGRKRKPDKTETLNIINKLNSTIDETYFIGDGETDCLTAKNAGVKSISVLWGYRDKEFLQSFGAKVFAYSPSDLLDLIK